MKNPSCYPRNGAGRIFTSVDSGLGNGYTPIGFVIFEQKEDDMENDSVDFETWKLLGEQALYLFEKHGLGLSLSDRTITEPHQHPKPYLMVKGIYTELVKKDHPIVQPLTLIGFCEKLQAPFRAAWERRRKALEQAGYPNDFIHTYPTDDFLLTINEIPQGPLPPPEKPPVAQNNFTIIHVEGKNDDVETLYRQSELQDDSTDTDDVAA